MRRSVVAGVCFLAACGGDEPDLVAPGEPTALATIVVTRSDDGSVVASALEGDGRDQIVVSLAEPRTVWVLHFRRTLSQLQIEPGLIPPAQSPDPGRPIPTFDVGRRAIIADGTTLGFEEITALDGAAADFRMKSTGGVACVDAGGCMVAGACEEPCPERSLLNVPEPPESPLPAALPTWEVCPTGFVAHDAAGVMACAPPPRVACAPDQVQWIDAATCAPIAACPAGDWPDPLPGSARWFVRNGGTGDGSIGTPFGSLETALSMAAAGDVVVLAKGTYDLPDTVSTSVVMVGACPAETHLVHGGDLEVTSEATFANLSLELGADLRARAPVRLDAAIVETREVFVTSAGRLEADRTRIIGRVDADAPVDLARTVVGGGVQFGLRIDASTTVLEDVVLESIGLDVAGENGRGTGVVARDGATVTGTRVFVDRASTYGVRNEDSSIELDDLVVRATQPRDDGEGGLGVYGTGSSTTTLHRALVEDNLTIGIYVRTGARAVLEDVVVHGTRARPNNDLDGQGLVVTGEGTAVNGLRVALADNQHVGLLMRESTVTMADLTVVDTLGRASDGDSGEGIIVEDGGVLTLERAHVARNRETGLIAVRDSRLYVTDLVVRDTMPNTEGRVGDGVRMTTGANGTFDRVAAIDNRTAGVIVREDAWVRMSDLTISGTVRSGADAAVTKSLYVQLGGQGEFERVLVHDVEGHGIDVRDGGDAKIHDVEVRDCGVVGLNVGDGAEVEMDKAVLADSGPEIVAVRVGGRLTLTEAQISGAQMSAGIVPTGIIVEPDGRLGLSRFEIADNEGVGLLLRTLAQADIVEGTIRGHSTGILVGDPEYDLTRLLERVAFVHNFANVTTP